MAILLAENELPILRDTLALSAIDRDGGLLRILGRLAVAPKSARWFVDEWPNLNAVVGIQKEQEYNIVELHARSDGALAGLLDAVVDTTSPVKFNGISHQFSDIALSFCRREAFGDVDISHENDFTFILEDVDSLQEPRSEVPIHQLNESDAPIVEHYWPYISLTGSGYLKRFIRHFPSACILEESTGELVAWGLLYDYNGVGALHVKEGYRRRGLGTMLLNDLAKKSLNSVHKPFAYVEKNNQASIGMFRKSGWTLGQDACWISVENRG